MNAETPPGTDGRVLRVTLVYMLTGLFVLPLLGLPGFLLLLTHAGLPLDPGWFYRLMTLHGSGMITGTLLAAMGGLAAVVGRSVRLSTRWLWITFAVYVLGVGLVVAAILIGRFATGWTVLYPLPFEGKTWGLGAGWAAYAGYFGVGLGFLLYCLHIVLATARTYGGLGKALAWRYLFSGGRDTTNPLPRPAELAGVVVGIDGVVAVVAGVIYLAAPLVGSGPLAQRVDPLFAKNLLMVFGHTIANLTMYLAAGLVYATLPTYTGREWKTTWPVVVALNLVILLVLIPVFHHLYQDFAQPFPLHLVGQFGSYAVGIPAVLVTIVGALGLIYRSGLRWSVPSILMVLGLWGWVFGGMGAALDGTIAINQVMHNTLWVPAHFHSYYLLGVVAFEFAFLYHLVGDLSGRREATISGAAAWLFGVGGAGFLVMFFFMGGSSVPRRFAVYLPEWQSLARFAVPFVILQGACLGWLVLDVLRRLKPAWVRIGS